MERIFRRAEREAMDKISFTKHENEVRGDFRAKLSAAESTEDVKKFFAQTVGKLIGLIFDSKVKVVYDDISLDPGGEEGYRVSAKLRKSGRFDDAWKNSDLPTILARFAEKAGNRYRHLEKKPEKTEAKMHHRL